MSNDIESISILRNAFRKNNLTLYLGAGVSIGSKLPSWEKLVLAMYFNKISQEQMNGWRPYSNYLYAIAEWYLNNSIEPLEITARKLRKHYEADAENVFLDDLYSMLYGGFLDNDRLSSRINREYLRNNNTTLNAVAGLCETSRKRIHAVVTYNYDSLLEIALDDYPYKSVFNPILVDSKSMPIYHVHGYIPLDKTINHSKESEIVFTEDQYHLVAENPYYWSNLVQLQLMSSSVGLMIGLSLSDRNMRRILDAIKNSPITSINFALLREPDMRPPDGHVLDDIHKKAIGYLEEFERSGIKSEQREHEGIFFRRPGIKAEFREVSSTTAGIKGLTRYQYEISGIIEQVRLIDKKQQEYVLKQLGIIPIWFKEISDIPGIISQISSKN